MQTKGYAQFHCASSSNQMRQFSASFHFLAKFLLDIGYKNIFEVSTVTAVPAGTAMFFFDKKCVFFK